MRKSVIVLFFAVSAIALSACKSTVESDYEFVEPSRMEVVEPIRKATFSTGERCKENKQGGNARMVNGYMVFDGALDGNRQVDPQIAVGGGYILHGTNTGLIIYDKEGNYVEGVRQSCFNNGIDPKLFFDIHNRIFAFDLWNPWDKEGLKPVSISVSESSDPTGAWNIYPVSIPNGWDGGGIGYSQKWIGYSFPGGEEQTFVMKTAEAKRGKAAKVYHFKGNLGHPVETQDATDDLLFFKINETNIVITRVTADDNDEPVSQILCDVPHHLEYVDYPPQSPQKGTEGRTASGDRNPKVLVVQDGYIWFSQAVNCEGRSAVQWHQLELDGTIVQTGLIKSETSSYIQTTLGVNKKCDVLVGFQETSPEQYISPRMVFRKKKDAAGVTGEIISLGEGKWHTDGVSWGDYSGTTIDGDNLLDLWTIQSITSETGKGYTVIAKVPYK